MWDRGGALAANEGDFPHAVCFPAAGWPADGILYGTERPGPHREHQICNQENFPNLPATHALTRGKGFDPLSEALEAAVATEAPSA